jgi:hypothetical protein
VTFVVYVAGITAWSGVVIARNLPGRWVAFGVACIYLASVHGA